MGFLWYDLTHSLDDPKATASHREIIKSKPFLKKLYEEWYTIFNDATQSLGDRTLLEIGSGGGFLKEIYPHFVTSDITPFEWCDMTFPAESIPFEDYSLGGIVMLNVLHHIPDPRNFFKEAQRTLSHGGKIIMIEPANSLFSRFIYKNFHHEPFDPHSKKWEIDSTGPMSGANGANPWIIFERDRMQFEKEFPNLIIKRKKNHTPFRYLLSGGVSMKALVPSGSFNFFKKVEKIISPLDSALGMFVTIEIEKINR